MWDSTLNSYSLANVGALKMGIEGTVPLPPLRTGAHRTLRKPLRAEVVLRAVADALAT
jgi:hypothetical protein